MSVVTAGCTLGTHSLIPLVLAEFDPDLGGATENAQQTASALSSTSIVLNVVFDSLGSLRHQFQPHAGKRRGRSRQKHTHAFGDLVHCARFFTSEEGALFVIFVTSFCELP